MEEAGKAYTMQDENCVEAGDHGSKSLSRSKGETGKRRIVLWKAAVTVDSTPVEEKLRRPSRVSLTPSWSRCVVEQGGGGGTPGEKRGRKRSDECGSKWRIPFFSRCQNTTKFVGKHFDKKHIIEIIGVR